MRASSVCLSVCLAALFAVDSGAAVGDDRHSSQFTYHQFRRDGGASCSVCYSDECWELPRARCEYYLLADRGRVQEGGGDAEIDGMMYDLMEEASISKISQNCIPYISQYTDRNKDNTCVGHRRCICDGQGRWLCNLETNCKPQEEPVVDHRLLVLISESLTYKRQRRWIHKTTTTAQPKKISYEDIAEWMYGTKPEIDQNIPLKERKKEGETTEHDVPLKNEEEEEEKTEHFIPLKNEGEKTDHFTPLKNEGVTTEGTETLIVKTTSKPQNIDYMDLDELLDTIGLPKNNRRKPQLNDNFYNIQDLDDDVKMMKNKDYEDFMNLFNGLDNINDEVEETTKVVIDLLPSVVSNNRNDSLNPTNVDLLDNDLNYDSNQLAINIMKREVANSNVTENATEVENSTIISNVNISSLTEDVLNPINNVIIEKEKEIKYLVQIKDNLEKFIKSYNDTKITLSINDNDTQNNETFSIFKVDVYPNSAVDLRKINPDNLGKLLYKLKRDIYEAVKDIKVIQKMSKIRYLPDDLQSLIKAMKYYIHNKEHVQNITQNELVLVNNKTRRHQFHTRKTINLHLVDIMRALEKKLPSSNVLASLSPSTARIIKRVIKNNYYDEMSLTGFKMYDPEYNLTNNLRNIGMNWDMYINLIDNSDPGDLLYGLKLLHIGLSRDISKIVDALTLVKYAHSRRMVPVEGQIGEELTDQISESLNRIHNKIQTLVNVKKETQKVNKKKSFLRKLKDFLTGSRKDIENLVENKVSKPEIIKILAKKRLDEMNRKKIYDYENTMRKWQDNLNIIPHRSKRSSNLEKSRNRMKNIIPIYLRGKVNPAIYAKRSKNSYTLRSNTDEQNEPITKKKPSFTKNPKIAEKSIIINVTLKPQI